MILATFCLPEGVQRVGVDIVELEVEGIGILRNRVVRMG